MAVTGRLALLALLGVVPVVLLPGLATVLAVAALLAVAVVVDLALAAPVAGLRLQRAGSAAVRLGETAEVRLTVANPSGRRLRAVLRDGGASAAVAWVE